MMKIYKIRNYANRTDDKPDVDDLIFGDDHGYVSTK